MSAVFIYLDYNIDIYTDNCIIAPEFVFNYLEYKMNNRDTRSTVLHGLRYIGCILFGMYFMTLLGGYFLFSGTSITKYEIVIERVGLEPFSTRKYVKNLLTNDEKLMISNLSGGGWIIDYEAQCDCITYISDRDRLRILRDTREGNMVAVYVGEIVRVVEPYSDHIEMFEEAEALLNKYRERYSTIIAKAP